MTFNLNVLIQGPNSFERNIRCKTRKLNFISAGPKAYLLAGIMANKILFTVEIYQILINTSCVAGIYSSFIYLLGRTK